MSVTKLAQVELKVDELKPLNAGLAKLLLKRGADGTKHTTHWQAALLGVDGFEVGSTALDISRLKADHDAECAATLEVLRRRCCSTCGITSSGMCELTAGEKKRLKRCGDCPARAPRARYCGEVCQRADWVSRHRGECAEARRARQAAGTEV